MKKYIKTYMGYKFEVIGAKGQGYEISYNNHNVGYADTLKEADEVIEQVVGNGVGNGVGDKMLSELN